jgi:drug/metabolite transporter, DME family
LVVAPIIWLWGTTVPVGGAWWILICLGVFQMGLPYLLFAHGLKSTPSHLAALISLLEPVLLPFWVYLARYGDPTYAPPGWWTWVGAGLILLGLLGRYASFSQIIKEPKSCE